MAMVYAVTSTTYTMAGGSLEWTKSASDVADIWTAPVTGSGSMTVTVGNLSDVNFFGRGAAIKVVGLTGQDPLAPIGQSGTGESTVNNLTAVGYTSSVGGSRGFFAAVDSEALGTPSSTDTGFGWSFDAGFFSVSGIFVYKTTNTAASGTNVTFNADESGSSAADWSWTALEIVPEVVVRQRAVVSRAAVQRAANW